MPRSGGANSRICCTPTSVARETVLPNPSAISPVALNSTTPSRKERALKLLRENRLDEAKALCEDVCRTEDQPGAWYLLGVIHGMLGDSKQAEGSYRRAIELKPDYADAHFRLGAVYVARGRLDEGIVCFRETVRLVPDHGAAYAAMGNAQVELGQIKEAIDSYQRTLEINSMDIESRVNLGNALSELGHKEEAVIAYRQAIEHRPGFIEAHHNLGLTLLDLNRYSEAIDSYQVVLQKTPEHPIILADLGVALSRQNRHAEAITTYRRVLAINPGNTETRYNLANALWATGNFSEAIENYRTAIHLRPDNADAHVNLGLVYLSLGNFHDGWKEYDWQWRRKDAPIRPFPPTIWDGTDLDGKNIFLHSEQGLGDELFFLRFVPWLRNRGAGRISYRPTTKITSLISRSKTLDRVVAPDTKPSDDEHVFSVGDLPKLLGMEHVGQIPLPLQVSPLLVQFDEIRQRLAKCGAPPYIGITWRAGTTKKNALYKEAPLVRISECLRPLRATVLALQRHPAPRELDLFEQSLGRPIHDLSALNDNLEKMLALLALINDYVGVPNTNMHLQAGLGKTARVLVPAPPDWRWMAEGKESPWFPGFTVYRQGYDGNWDGAFRELENDLRQSLVK